MDMAMLYCEALGSMLGDVRRTHSFRIQGFRRRIATRLFRERFDRNTASSTSETMKEAHRSPSFMIMEISWAGSPANKKAADPSDLSWAPTSSQNESSRG